MKLELRVMRQGIDPTAESSLHALRDIMGLPVTAVEHGELLQFTLRDEPEPQRVREVLEAAACQAGRYVNLNRDVILWDATASTQTAPVEGCHVDVWVVPQRGSDARALQWFRQHSDLPIEGVQRGRWYRVHVATADLQEARHVVEQLAASRTRRQGLLSNPHVETFHILRAEHNAPGGVRHAV